MPASDGAGAGDSGNRGGRKSFQNQKDYRIAQVLKWTKRTERKNEAERAD